MSVAGWLLQLSYRLSRHYIGALSIGVWLVVIGLGVVVVDVLPSVRILPPVKWAAGAIGVATLALLIWGKAIRYRLFCPARAASSLPPDVTPIRGLEHVKVRATGNFSVEGKERFYANLEAIYHTFETREHAVMAHVPWTRFLLFAQSHRVDAGMWYIFFKPHQIESIQLGTLKYGSRPKPALRVVYRGEKRSEEVCLAFENEADRAKAAVDLWHDLKKSSPAS